MSPEKDNKENYLRRSAVLFANNDYLLFSEHEVDSHEDEQVTITRLAFYKCNTVISLRHEGVESPLADHFVDPVLVSSSMGV